MADRLVFTPEKPRGELVPLTAEEETQRMLDQSLGEADARLAAFRAENATGCRDELRARRQRMSDLAALVSAGTATAAETRDLLALQARLLDRLSRLVLSDLDTGA